MILERARRVLEIEAQAVTALIRRLDEQFIRAIEILEECQGRVVLTGMGKSGFIAKKIAATLASTGTPALYLHPAEGVHGDLGMIVRGDVVIAVSNSGVTPELIEILPALKRLDVKVIALVGSLDSIVAKQSDVALDVSVEEEACPLDLTPTASTTAALAMGDALAVALFEKRGFRAEDFAVLHPGGRLGRRLLLRVRDLMHMGDEMPIVSEETLMRDAVLEISSKRLGMTAVIDGGGRVAGIITDGDLRRGLEKYRDVLDRPAKACMTRYPKIIDREELAARAVQVMEQHKITSLLIVDGAGRPDGVVHLHDILRAGIV
ncbi:MAG: KpsF/GutQ family sugar-phosphate isomerase [candidate division NC10 bacterium]|nr:KpsF/GutQ family sugar-phosphate isomerase [candidate division NC10 bacterium]